MRLRVRTVLKGVAVAALVALPHTASAEPILQLYVEGATYDAEHESWVFDIIESNGKARIWTIGNTAGPGSKGDILDVKLSIAYPDLFESSGPDLGFSLTGSTINADFEFYDDLIDFDSEPDPDEPYPSELGMFQWKDDGSAPTLNDGRLLAPHGVYEEGTEWQEFLLDDFNTSESPIGDFVAGFPDDFKPDSAQINVYDFSLDPSKIPDTEDFFLHFDLYNHVEGANHAVFAPFSHDAGTGVNERVPVPPTGALLAGALATLCIWNGCRRRRLALG